MRRGWPQLSLLVASACGRIGFDPLGGGGNPDSPLVPGGTFLRGFDAANDGMFTSQNHPATVSDFRLDRFEVSVARFRAFVAAGLGTQASPPAAGAGGHPRLAGSGWIAAWSSELPVDVAALRLGLSQPNCTWTDAPGANEDLPLNCVSWFEAMAFCIWDGGYLPTDAEWSYAAAGGDEQRAYPWSSPPGSLAIDGNDANYGQGLAIDPVGSKSPAGDGKWGQADLGGNVFEYFLDAIDLGYVDPCVDCARLDASTQRGFRGGGWATRSVAALLRVQNRGFGGMQPNAAYDVGFRCARPP